jgi:hypothetical protein
MALVSAILYMTGSPNLSKNRISGYLAPNALFTENRWFYLLNLDMQPQTGYISGGKIICKSDKSILQSSILPL